MGHDDGEIFGEIKAGSPISQDLQLRIIRNSGTGSSAQEQPQEHSPLFLTVWQGDTHTTDGLKSYSWTIGNGRSKINVVDPWSSQHLFNLYRFGFG